MDGRRNTILAAGAAAVAITTMVFLTRNAWTLDAKQAAFWDVFLKVIAGLVGAFGAWLALEKHFHDKAKDLEASRAEAQRPFNGKRQEVYYQLLGTTAALGNKGREDPTRAKDELDFWILYWGAIPLVADKEVGLIIDRFSEMVYEPGIEMRNLSMELARRCRQSLGFEIEEVLDGRTHPPGPTWVPWAKRPKSLHRARR